MLSFQHTPKRHVSLRAEKQQSTSGRRFVDRREKGKEGDWLLESSCFSNNANVLVEKHVYIVGETDFKIQSVSTARQKCLSCLCKGNRYFSRPFGNNVARKLTS